MYSILLTAHSWVRWLVLLAVLFALVRAIRGLATKSAWSRPDDLAGTFCAAAYDTQFTLGLILFFISPLIKAAMGDMGTAMATPAMRFFLVEHTTMMLVAVVVVHITRARGRKAPDDQSRHRRTAIGMAVALLLTLAAIPWPSREFGRPLLRLMESMP